MLHSDHRAVRHVSAPRYGCHECREDAEMSVLGKANPEVLDGYLRHLRSCETCRRQDAVLRALYLPPSVPPSPDLASQEREFSGILRRTHGERGARRERARLRRGGLIVSSVAAAVAVGWLLLPSTPSTRSVDRVGLPKLVGLDELTTSQGSDHETSAMQPFEGGIEHRAQTFARIVAGKARLRDQGGAWGEGKHLAAGTSFEVPAPHRVQMAIVGKLLASIEPGSVASFDEAGPELVVIGLRRGMLAIRYDRLPADPILLIRTPSAVVRVVGTVFTVAVDTQGQTSVSVLRGHVEILAPKTLERLAEVDAGYRFDGGTATYVDVGREEVSAALPVSNEALGEETTLATGRIPTTWVVPGLPAQPEFRTLDRVRSHSSTHTGPSDVELELELELGGMARATPTVPKTTSSTGEAPDERGATALPRDPPPLPASLQRRGQTDDGAELLSLIAAQVDRSRKDELAAALERCRVLYASAETRFRAAACLTKFQGDFGDEPGAEEGLLLIGILRMDFAQDHQAAIRYFERFLKRSPEGPLAELARYRIFLAATERGNLGDALRKGREYLELYPEGRHVGRVIQRFPELKRAL